MRLRLFVSLIALLVSASAAFAEPAAGFLTPGKTYNYKVTIAIDSKSGSPVGEIPQKLNSVLDLAIRHKVEKGMGQGEIQSTVSVQSASLAAGGQKIQLAPATFPQVIVITDENGTVKKVFGGAGPGMPGLNFTNFILFLLPDMSKANASQLKEGDQWSREVALTGAGQSVKVASTYKGMEKIGDSSTMRLQQTFELVSPKEQSPSGPLSSFKGTATTNYAVPGCAPVKSHADVEVVGRLDGSKPETSQSNKDPSEKKDTQEFRAKLSIDFAAVK